MPTRTTRTRTRTRRTTQRVTELERRDTPAWWSVAAPVPAEGTVGVTDATHAGSLVSNPDYAPANGAATVWADTAELAVAKALTGTIGVTLPGGQTVEHAFGPATVGATAADHKAYLAVGTGTSVALAFEDMAGQPGCDYDYNDRSWSGVSVTGASDPVVPYPGPHSWPWLNPGTGDSATVGLEVTRPDDLTFRWTYTLANNNMPVLFVSPGINQFQVTPEDVSGVTRLTTSMADWEMLATDKMVYWRVRCMTPGPYLGIGGTATFGFDTPATPIRPATGGVSVAGVDGGGTAAATMAADGEQPWAESSSSMGGPDTCVAVDDGIGGPTKGPGVVRVEITKWNGDPVGAAGLKVGKWTDAFNILGDVARIKPVDATTGNDIIDLDDDRFNVWVYDKTKWNANTPHINVKISTDNVVGFAKDYNDAAHNVDMVRFTGDRKGIGAAGQGWFWSDSQLLVSNNVDDVGPIPGVGTDEESPAGMGPLKNEYMWKISDRTHKVALRGTVKAEYVFIDSVPPIPGKTDIKAVPYRNVTKVHVNIMNAPGKNTGVVTFEDANNDMMRANEAYAQVGVLLIPDIKKDVPWPVGVNLADGLEQVVSEIGGKMVLPAELKSLLTPSLRSPVFANVEVYYVNFIAINSVDSQDLGFSIPNCISPADKYSNSVFISSRYATRTSFVVPHEIGHVLTNRGHFEGLLEEVNLMQVDPSQSDHLTATKRLTTEQYARITP